MPNETKEKEFKSFTDFTNLYEVQKTLRFELKPSERTFGILKSENLFKSDIFSSKIFIKNSSNTQAPQQQVNNYQFTVNFDELNLLAQSCDRIKIQIEEVKNFLEKKPEILWSVWINPEGIKVIDKNLYYKLKEKKCWKKKFWNEEKKQISIYDVKLKKGLNLTLDDVDAFFNSERSAQNKQAQAGTFSLLLYERLSFLLNQYANRKKQLFLDIEESYAINQAFLKKRELVSRIRSYLSVTLNLEKVFSLFIPTDERFNKELKEKFSFLSDLNDVIKDITTIFSETDLYLHNNIQRRFTFNARAINPNPESTSKTTNQQMTEREILNKIISLEKEILDLKIKKANLKWQRKVYGSNNDWNRILNALNPSNREGKFSQLAELRRDLEEVKITHYAVLLEKNGNFFLAMENKKSGNYNKKLNELLLFNLPDGNTAQALLYNTLTFKALRRLCLEESGSMKTEKFLDTECNWKEKIGKREVNKDWRLKEHFSNLKKYLQKITRENSEKLGVTFSESQYNDWANSKTLIELEAFIDKQGYQCKWKGVSWEKLQELKNIEIFQIFNKDFLIEENFAVTQKDKERLVRINSAKEKYGERFVPKQNRTDRQKDLYTLYWDNFFKDKEARDWQIKPEGKFYVRLQDGDKVTDRDVASVKVNNKQRFFENKIFVDFGLVVNPSIDIVEAKQKIKEGVKNHIFKINKKHKEDKKDFYILGLDRGVNRIVSYSLFNSELKVVKSDLANNNFYEEGESGYSSATDFVSGNWSFLNSKGQFIQDAYKFSTGGDIKFFKQQIISTLKSFYNFSIKKFENKEIFYKKFVENEDQFYVDIFPKNQHKGKRFCIFKEKNERGESFGIADIKKEVENAQDRKHILNEAEQVSRKISVVGDCWFVDNNNNRVFDFVLSFYAQKARRYLALYKQEILSQKIQNTEKELEALLFESVEELKDGYVSFVVGKVVEIARKAAELKNKKLYIVLEDLSNYGTNNKTPENSTAGTSYKDDNHEKSLSVTIYQKLENALVRKFNYIQTKKSNSSVNNIQLSPKINRVEDIKEFREGNQLGNIIFVDPRDTSRTCPCCEKKLSRLQDSDGNVVCDSCQFSSKSRDKKNGYDFIKNADILATYNIAKRGLKIIQK